MSRGIFSDIFISVCLLYFSMDISQVFLLVVSFSPGNPCASDSRQCRPIDEGVSPVLSQII